MYVCVHADASFLQWPCHSQPHSIPIPIHICIHTFHLHYSSIPMPFMLFDLFHHYLITLYIAFLLTSYDKPFYKHRANHAVSCWGRQVTTRFLWWQTMLLACPPAIFPYPIPRLGENRMSITLIITQCLPCITLLLHKLLFYSFSGACCGWALYIYCVNWIPWW